MTRDAAGRSTRRFRRLAADLRAQRRPCCICHGDKGPIRYDLDWPDPLSFSVQHIQDWRNHPELREDPGNLDAAHLTCNTADGNTQRRKVPLDLGQTSRRW